MTILQSCIYSEVSSQLSPMAFPAIAPSQAKKKSALYDMVDGLGRGKENIFWLYISLPLPFSLSLKAQRAGVHLTIPKIQLKTYLFLCLKCLRQEIIHGLLRFLAAV